MHGLLFAVLDTSRALRSPSGAAMRETTLSREVGAAARAELANAMTGSDTAYARLRESLRNVAAQQRWRRGEYSPPRAAGGMPEPTP